MGDLHRHVAAAPMFFAAIAEFRDFYQADHQVIWDSVTRLRGANSLRTSEPLRIHVIPQTRGVTLRSLPKSSVTKIEVGSY